MLWKIQRKRFCC